MCGCKLHGDGPGPCTCRCPSHEAYRDEDAHRAEHPAEAPAQDVADVLAAHRLTTPVQCACGWRDTDPTDGHVNWHTHVAAALAPLLAAARAEGRAEVEATVQALAEEIEGMPRTNFDFIRRERADLAARLRNLTPDPSALADRERAAGEKAWDEGASVPANTSSPGCADAATTSTDW